MAKLLYFRDLDSHYVINLFGLHIKIEHKCRYKSKKVEKFGISNEIREPRLIVSMSSYPARINTTHLAVETLLTQTLKPNKIILWLSQEEFPNLEQDLPNNLLNLKQYGLTIEWCENIKSYKKIIPALRKYPNDIIITVDDDIYYESNMIESLYNEYLKDKNNIYTKRAVRLDFDGEALSAVSPRKYDYVDYQAPNYLSQLMGGSGVLYPPHSLYKDAADNDKFLNILPTHDDAWLWAMAVLNKTKIKIVDGHKINLYMIPNTQQVGLIHCNKKNCEGISLEDAYVKLFKAYPQLIDIINKDINYHYTEDDIEVFIMTYNRLNLFKESLDSVLNQTKNVKITVVDNVSTDGTEDYVKTLLEKYDNLRYYKQPTHLSTCGEGINSLNHLFRTKYAIFFHDDDIMHSQYVEFVVQILNKYNNVDLVCTLLKTFTDSKNIKEKHFDEIKYRILKNKKDFALHTYVSYCTDGTSICFPNIVYKTENLNNLIRDDIYGKLADKPGVIDVIQDGIAVQILEKEIFNYRIHSQQDSMTNVNGPYVEQIINYNKYFKNSFKNNLKGMFFFDLFSIKTVKSFYKWGNLKSSISFFNFLNILHRAGAYNFIALVFSILPAKLILSPFIFANKKLVTKTMRLIK